jgi:hypothetical protein
MGYLIRALPSKQCIEDDPKRVHVTPGFQWAKRIRDLHGAHIRDGAGEQCAPTAPPRGIIELGQTKAEHAGSAEVAYQDIGRCQVPVNHRLVMHGFHGLTDVQEQLQALGQREGVMLRIVGDGNSAVYQGHRKKSVGSMGMPPS